MGIRGQAGVFGHALNRSKGDQSIMSLKAFHIIFVTISTLFCAFFGTWSLDQYRTVDPSGMNLVYIIGPFAGLIVLPVYGWYFLKKLKHVSFL